MRGRILKSIDILASIVFDFMKTIEKVTIFEIAYLLEIEAKSGFDFCYNKIDNSTKLYKKVQDFKMFWYIFKKFSKLGHFTLGSMGASVCFVFWMSVRV